MRARGCGPDLPRDRAVLIRLARHRLLPLAQIHRLVFTGLDRSRVSRRMTALARNGWVSIWEKPVDRGGRPRFIAPTIAGLRWALTRITEETATRPYAPLIATMLRRDGRRPIRLACGVIPPFLTHLEQVNDVLISLELDRALGVVWASSWNRPLPNLSHGVRLPQPDGAVVVTRATGAPVLCFLEHDRGGESLAHFRSSKIDRYRQLAQRPGLLADLTGFSSFRVWVTVRTGNSALTADRIADLERSTGARLARSLFTFAAFDQDYPISGDLLGSPRLGDLP